MPQWKEVDPDQLLHSDTSKRLDVKPIIEQAWEEAEKNKVILEVAQRKDKKMRLEAQKKREAAMK